MFPLHVHSADFKTVLTGLRKIKNFAGAIITIPHKNAAYDIATIKGPIAKRTGGANVLIPFGKDQWSCEMFDGIGLIKAIQNQKLKIEGMKTLVIGAGGAGTAIAVALREMGDVGKIGIIDTDKYKADKLVMKLENAEIAGANPADYQLIVNATPVGMGTTEIPLDPVNLKSGMIVCDTIMHPMKTRLLKEAEKRGCFIVKGIDMLLGQVDPIINMLGFR